MKDRIHEVECMLSDTAAEVASIFRKIQAEKRPYLTPGEKEAFEDLLSEYCHLLTARNSILEEERS